MCKILRSDKKSRARPPRDDDFMTTALGRGVPKGLGWTTLSFSPLPHLGHDSVGRIVKMFCFSADSTDDEPREVVVFLALPLDELDDRLRRIGETTQS